MGKLSMQILLEESDRGSVLVGQAAVEEEIELLLRAVFVKDPKGVKSSVGPLFQTNGPLASFWSKTQLANALGLLPFSIYSDLERIRLLRNQFAHQKDPVDFDEPRVVKVVMGLSTTARYADLMKGKRYIIKTMKGGKKPTSAQLQEEGIVKFHKSCFSFCVTTTIGFLQTLRDWVEKGGVQTGQKLASQCDNSTDALWTEKLTNKRLDRDK